MPAKEPYIDNNQTPQQRAGPACGSMALPPSFPHDSTWTPPAVSKASYSGRASLFNGRTSSTINHARACARASCSTTSSCEGSWASSTTDNDEIEREVNWDEWEQGSDSAHIMPKNEPTDEDGISMSEFQNTALAAPETSASTSGPKRGRGRPRKNPVPAPTNGAKVTKGRSKTGCITCRRRKKKCDEGKPACAYPAPFTATCFVADR